MKNNDYKFKYGECYIETNEERQYVVDANIDYMPTVGIFGVNCVKVVAILNNGDDAPLVATTVYIPVSSISIFQFAKGV